MNNVDLKEKIDIPLDATEVRDGDGFVSGNEVFVARKVGGTSEGDFEDDVEAYLGKAGWKTFEVERVAAKVSDQSKWNVAQRDYDRKLAIKKDSLIGFVKETQSKEWEKVEGLYGDKAQDKLLERIETVLEPHQDSDGLIEVLRKGFDMAPGAHFQAC